MEEGKGKRERQWRKEQRKDKERGRRYLMRRGLLDETENKRGFVREKETNQQRKKRERNYSAEKSRPKMEDVGKSNVYGKTQPREYGNTINGEGRNK